MKDSNVKPAPSDFVSWMNLGCDKFDGTYNFNRGVYHLTKRLLLSSGLSLSIQANEGAYCCPRENSECESYEMYHEFEIGFPSEKLDKLMHYAEQPEIPTDTVYPYVPKSLIQEIIDDNGGVVGFGRKE